jgi:hypothetical protein
MRAPDDYQLGKCLRSSTSLEEYTAVRQADGREVTLKRYRKDKAGPSSRAALEFDALRAVAGPGIPEAVELVRPEDASPVLVLAPSPGLPLLAWIETHQPASTAFLEVALQIVALLGRVHDARMVHRSVSPSAIWVVPETRLVQLGEFGLAQPLGTATASGARGTGAHERAVSSLRYISPEQTGRMGRGVDLRSDLYSLGATLYHAVTGSPPFDDKDPLSLIHAHMAKLPAAALELRPDLPARLSRILSKLLQKSPEERYQTAHALHRDLEECRGQLERTGAIDDAVPLARTDVPHRPLFTRRLYGREPELRSLNEAWAAAAAGATTAIFLAGPPGVGKSALVHELRAPIACARGYLASGKFDLYRRDLPYSGFLQAFESFAQQILTESDVSLARWREELGAGLGAIARVLVDLVPDLGHVLRDSEPVPPLDPSETLARLSLAVQRIVHSIATPEHPLALFLDDMQWADAGSFELLRVLLLQTEPRALLVLVAYRDGEIDATHPLRALDAELERSPRTLALAALSDAECTQMLADALGHGADEVSTLAECIARKTGRVPLIIQQFLQHLYDARMVIFHEGGWTWNDATLAALDIPESAVEMMTAKIACLDSRGGEVLKLASCLGDAFDVAALAEITGLEIATLRPALHVLADEGLLAPCPQGFRFVHDRIREAAQALWTDAERTAFHYRAGRRLLERTPAAALDERLFEILDHLNRGATHVRADERAQLVELNLRAGRKALKTGAAAAAEPYLARARELFVDSDWARDPTGSFELFVLSADRSTSGRQYDQALAFLDLLDRRPALSRLDRARIAARRTAIYSISRTPREAADVGLAGLAALGMHLPADPSLAQVWYSILRAMWWMRLRTEREFPGVDPRDQSWVPIQMVSRELIAPAFRSNWRLQALLSTTSLHITLRHGSEAPAFSLSGAAMTISNYTGNYTLGSRLADVVLKLLELAPTQPGFYRARMSTLAFIKAFVVPRRSLLPEMRRCRDEALEHGDVTFALYSENLYGYLMWTVGERLRKVELTRREFIKLGQSVGYADWKALTHFLPVLAALTGSGSMEREELPPAVLASANLLPIRSAWIACRCMRGEFTDAFLESETLHVDIDRLYCAFPHVTEVWLFRGLSAAALATDARAGARRRYRRVLRESLRRLQRWSRHGPANFAHAARLLEAERARLGGRITYALLLYKRAAELAHTHEYLHHEALIHERRARLLVRLRRETEGTTALQRAAELYEEWGAHVVSARLIQECRDGKGPRT